MNEDRKNYACSAVEIEERNDNSYKCGEKRNVDVADNYTYNACENDTDRVDNDTLNKVVYLSLLE